jgi:negative regulator of sigma-B (phosphoserine phosphatase)
MTEVASVVEWAVAGRPVPGEQRSGDRALVLSAGREALVAAVDGVGHGHAAARAADVAIGTLREAPWSDVVGLVQRCHAALQATRGAAVGLAVLSADGTATWLGVGNISGRLVPGGEPSPAGGYWLGSQIGVAGDDLPPLRPARLPLHRGDLLVLATDGIDAAFADELVATGPCDEIAERVLRLYARATDDALVVAARYLGEDVA